ncbi:MAG: domain containing protein, partial [Thermoleophilia bacterium]|nr:domain containing protein [Thermoleophilia bacterium]
VAAAGGRASIVSQYHDPAFDPFEIEVAQRSPDGSWSTFTDVLDGEFIYGVGRSWTAAGASDGSVVVTSANDDTLIVANVAGGVVTHQRIGAPIGLEWRRPELDVQPDGAATIAVTACTNANGGCSIHLFERASASSAFAATGAGTAVPDSSSVVALDANGSGDLLLVGYGSGAGPAGRFTIARDGATGSPTVIDTPTGTDTFHYLRALRVLDDGGAVAATTVAGDLVVSRRTAGATEWISTAHPIDTTDAPVGIDAEGVVVAISTTHTGFQETEVAEARSITFAPGQSPRTSPLIHSGRYGFGIQGFRVGANGNALLAVHDCGPQCNTYNTASYRLSPMGDAAIATGPSGTVRTTTPTFTFQYIGGATTDLATFECSIDAGAWTACPATFTTLELTQGVHELRVRAKTAQGVSPSPDSRTFTVDTVAPLLTFTSAPGATTADRVVSIGFASTEQDTFFECRSGIAEFVACESPHALTNLTDGAYTFDVRATDAVGNVSAPIRRSFSVVSSGPVGDETGRTCELDRRSGRSARAVCGPPKPASCAQGTAARATGGVLTGVALTADACFREVSKGVWVSAGPVAMNGIRHTGSLRLDDNKDRAWIGAGLVSFSPNGVRLAIPQLTNVSTVAKVKLPVPMPKGAKLAGFELEGMASLSFTGEDGGQSKLDVSVDMPQFFTARRLARGERNPPSEGLTIDLGIVTSNDKGLEVSGGAKVARVYAGRYVELHDLSVGFDTATGAILGGATMLVPGADAWGSTEPKNRATVRVSVAMRSGDVTGMSMIATKLNKPLTHGFFIQTLGATFSTAVAPMSLEGVAGVSFLPNIGDGYVALVNGKLKATLENRGPAFEVSGDLSLATLPVGEVKAVFQSWDRAVKLSGSLSLGAYGQGAFAVLKEATIAPGRTTAIPITGRVRFPFTDDSAGRIIIGDRGFAGCVGDTGVTTGGAYIYGKGWVQDGACDIGAWEKKVSSTGQRSRAGRSIGSTIAVDLPPKLPVAKFAVGGAGAAPRVALIGPDGTRIDAPVGGRGIVSSGHVIYPDPTAPVLYVTVVRPAGGTWRIVELDGSSPLTDVRVAEGLPTPKVTARVGGMGSARSLTYTVRPIPGQVVQFAELGRFGSADLLKARGAGGRFRFVPARGVGGRRTIIAVVLQGGVPRTTFTVASYTAPTTGVVVRPARVKAIHRGSKLVITLQRQAAAADYTVQVQLAGGRRLLRTSATPSFIIGNVPSTSTGTFRIWVNGRNGAQSPVLRGRISALPRRR